MPNFGYAGTGPSVITPELTKLVWGDPQQQYLNNMRQQQQQLQQQKFDEAKQNRNLANQAKATQFINSSTDEKKFATPDDGVNQIINGRLQGVREKYAKMIHDNPNIDEGDLENQMTSDLSDINDYSGKAKGVINNIKNNAALYGKMPGVNPVNLEQNAVRKALFVKDPNTGEEVLNPHPDVNFDAVGQEMHDNPTNYVNGDAASDAIFKEANASKIATDIGTREGTDRAGVKINSSVKGSVYPWQHVTKDASGKINGIATNAVPLVNPDTKQPLVDPNTKQPLQGVDDNTFSRFNTFGYGLKLKGDVDKMLTDAGYDPTKIPSNDPKYIMMLKHAMLLDIDKNSPKNFEPTNIQSNTSAEDKREMGALNLLGQQINKTEQNKDDKLTGSNYGKLIDAFNGDQKILNAGTPVTIGGRKFMDVTDVVGGFSTNADRKLSASQPEFNKVGKILIDPVNPGKLYTVEHNYNEVLSAKKAGHEDGGHLQVYDGKDLANIMRRHAPSNGMDNSNDFNKLLKLKPIQEPKEESPSEKRTRLANELRNQSLVTPSSSFNVVK